MQENINHLAPVAEASVSDRSEFIWKCYAHVVGAILAFAAVEVYLFQSGVAEAIAAPLLNNWLLARVVAYPPPMASLPDSGASGKKPP